METLVIVGLVSLVVWYLYKSNQEQKRLEGDDPTHSIEQAKQHGKKISIVIDDVINDWMELIVGAHGRADDFFNFVIKHLEAVAVPEITWEYTNVFSAKLTCFTSHALPQTRSASGTTSLTHLSSNSYPF